MGSMIQLSVGRLEIDWGKNNAFGDHSALFQTSDVTNIPYYYAGAEKPDPVAPGERAWEIIVEHKEGLAKPLAEVIDRINLLGHTPIVCEEEFRWLANLNDFDAAVFRFSDLQKALAAVDVTAMSANYGEGGEDFGKFFRREIFPRLDFSHFSGDVRHIQYRAAHGMENISAYTILQMLAHNPTARDLPVQWAFNDIEQGGWAERSDFIRPVDREFRFLIVTEGSSDAAIIKHALRLLRPHIADFFDFVDMEEGYPFTGTGNLFRFVQGLISISVLNNVIVLYDNDAEGVANHARCRALTLPDNMKVLKLPDDSSFQSFPTVGPNDKHHSDINGRAASIECYLDLPADSCVRWTSYNHALEIYQGELLGKTKHMRAFLDQRCKMPTYDYSKMEKVLDAICKTAVAMREAVTLKEYSGPLEDYIEDA